MPVVPAPLSEAQVRRVLGLETRFRVHALPKAHHVPLRYTAADLHDDLDAHRVLDILPGRHAWVLVVSQSPSLRLRYWPPGADPRPTARPPP